MCDKELLVGYLYDELRAPERAEFEAHVRVCAECRDELAELRQTRAHLTLWAPPEPDFGLHVVRGAAAPRVSRVASLRAWGLAAAAMLVLAASAAIANLEVRYGADGLVVRTGWGREAEPSTAASDAAVPAVAAGDASERMKEQLAALDRKLAEVERRLATQPGSPAGTDRGGMSDAELVRTVRQLVAESEARTERAMARRVGQLWTDVGAMRAADLARIEQSLRQVQGVTNAELIQHRETLNRLWRVSQQR
jgi:hypothetical protein